jgi:hypothetical protein
VVVAPVEGEPARWVEGGDVAFHRRQIVFLEGEGQVTARLEVARDRGGGPSPQLVWICDRVPHRLNRVRDPTLEVERRPTAD